VPTGAGASTHERFLSDPVMTIDEALRAAARELAPHSSTPRLDAELLLGHVLRMSRAALLARPTADLDSSQVSEFDLLLERRSLGEPVAYLTGHREFYGLDFTITRDVLVPRPETESVVEVCLEALPESDISHLADIGTGSGVIAVSVAVHRPNARVFATDISPQAIEVARQNCLRHRVAERVSLFLGNLLEPVPQKVNVIAANLPYVSAGEAEPDVATWEPHVAVFGGGGDGTELIRAFLAQAPDYILPGGTIVMETAYSQGRVVSELARKAFSEAGVNVHKDLAGYDRVVVVKLP
jgi:release factor glutamine methyltransferase